MKFNAILACSLLSIVANAQSAHINLPQDRPGITALFAFSPQTTKPLTELAEVLLRGESTLTPGERELIAMYVSVENGCIFCSSSHAAAAVYLLNGNSDLVEAVLEDINTAPISDKMKSLLVIAGDVQKGGLCVTAEHIAQARANGATDKEIHDTVLIAAAFCMFNRYVDGLATPTPTDPQVYAAMGKDMAELGYMRPRK